MARIVRMKLLATAFAALLMVACSPRSPQPDAPSDPVAAPAAAPPKEACGCASKMGAGRCMCQHCQTGQGKCNCGN